MTLNPAGNIDALAAAISQRANAADLYFALAESHWRAGDLDGYAKFARLGYFARPTLGLFPSDGDGASSAALRELARALVERGVAYSAILATLAAAEARLGNHDAVRALMDGNRFVLRGALSAPGGQSIEAFNAAVAAEIRAGLTYYDAPEDRSIRQAWRFDAFREARTPALLQLKGVLRDLAARYVETVAAAPGPFAASRPAAYDIDGWAVVSDGAGYHRSHMHPRAWATGVYYVVQPPASRTGPDAPGWLTIGPPPDLAVAAQVGWERRRIEPVAGSFVVMPGHFWHETSPMGVDEERMCVAFEIQPAELAVGG